jgi:PAS domain S-box-containing protein
MESELSRTVDALPGLVWTALPDGRGEFFNNRWREYTGLSMEEASGDGWRKAVHPDDLPGLIATQRKCIESGRPNEAEARMRRHDGVYRCFLFRAAPITDASGRVIKWCGLNIDIEDRKRAEEGLRMQERRLKAIVDGLPEMFALATPQGEFISANSKGLEYFGVNLPKLLAWRTSDVIHKDDLEAFAAKTALSIATGAPFDAQCRFLRTDGVYRWFHMRGYPMRDREGEIFQWFHLATDIEDRKRAEAERQESEEALGRLRAELAHVSRVNSLGALTASIAHEINQPLGGIIANATTGLSLLDMYPLNVEGMRETYRRTLRDGRRAADVLKRLRAMYSKRVVTSDAVDLNEAANEVVDLLRSEIRRHRIVLQVERPPDLPPVMGDRVQLQQVMLNLLLNAIEAMHDVDNRPRQLLIRTERGTGEQVQLAVCDTGPGIDPQHADHLFNAFYTTKREGMGIGLSVSRSIIESHHGRLWAEPNQGPGATFSFSIPCLPGGATAAGSASYPLQPASVAAQDGVP